MKKLVRGLSYLDVHRNFMLTIVATFMQVSNGAAVQYLLGIIYRFLPLAFNVSCHKTSRVSLLDCFFSFFQAL